MDRNAVCDAYADVAHGSVEPSEGTRQNDLVTITCNDGYELVESVAVVAVCCSVLQCLCRLEVCTSVDLRRVSTACIYHKRHDERHSVS